MLWQVKQKLKLRLLWQSTDQKFSFFRFDNKVVIGVKYTVCWHCAAGKCRRLYRFDDEWSLHGRVYLALNPSPAWKGKTFCRRGTMHGEEGAGESWQGPRQRTQSCVFGFTRKRPIFNLKAGYVRCATWCIPRGVSCIRVFRWALGRASSKTWIHCNPIANR